MRSIPRRKRAPRRAPTVAVMVARFWHMFALKMQEGTPAQRRRIERQVSTIFPYTPPWDESRQERR